METFKEKLKSVMDGIAEKGKSPFVLTFIIVWVLHHWELVYLMLNFGADYTAFQKLDFVQERLKGETYRDLLIYPIIYSVLSYVGYLGLSLFFQWINGMHKWGQAWVKLSTKDPNVIDISKYNELKISVSNKEARLNDLSNQYNQLQTFKQEYQSYKTDLLKPIAYFMLKTSNPNDLDAHYPADPLIQIPSFMLADWNIQTGVMPSFNMGMTKEKYSIRSKQFYDSKDQFYGNVENFNYDRANRLITFGLSGIANLKDGYYYSLFVVNENELLGYRNGNSITGHTPQKVFVHFEKINP